MSTPNPSTSVPSTRREQRQARAAAQRDLNRLQRQARRGVRSLRRESETTAIVAGAKLTGLGIRGINHLTTRLRTGR
jgi:hypothetical protein